MTDEHGAGTYDFLMSTCRLVRPAWAIMRQAWCLLDTETRRRALVSARIAYILAVKTVGTTSAAVVEARARRACLNLSINPPDACLRPVVCSMPRPYVRTQAGARTLDGIRIDPASRKPEGSSRRTRAAQAGARHSFTEVRALHIRAAQLSRRSLRSTRAAWWCPCAPAEASAAQARGFALAER